MPTKDYKPKLDAKHKKDTCPKCGGLKLKGSSTCWPCYTSLPERFHSKYSVLEDGCWLWTGNKNMCGYGVSRYQDKKIGAHRLSWLLLRGEIPVGLHVLHRCDNPPCVNPDHLFLGTQRDNNADKISKGRHGIGERNGNTALTTEQVIAIRNSPLRNLDLARLHNLDPSTISHIRRRTRWRHV